MGSPHATIKLASEDEQIVWAEVYAPGIPDADGDYMDAVGIQQMAYKFMKDLRLKKIDVQHTNKLCDACVVESFIARKGDPDFIEGAWVIGLYIADKSVWEKVKKQEINGFSMEALVTRRSEIVEVIIPEIVSGKTMKSEDHEHTFYVSYDDNGHFRGGRTDPGPDGHVHTIRKGTITEDANGHSHRFSHIEGLKNLLGS